MLYVAEVAVLVRIEEAILRQIDHVVPVALIVGGLATLVFDFVVDRENLGDAVDQAAGSGYAVLDFGPAGGAAAHREADDFGGRASCLNESLNTTAPVARPTTLVRNGNDSNLGIVRFVDNGVRKAPQWKSARLATPLGTEAGVLGKQQRRTLELR